VNHRKLILAVSVGIYGSCTDTTIILFDEAMKLIKEGEYSAYQFQIYDSLGNLIHMSDVHTINDNGYSDCVHMMEPSKHAHSNAERVWSKMVESLRKVLICNIYR
jgi:hypothetical protein